MASSPIAQRRDDDPPHPNFDGIIFRATTDRSGIVISAASAQVAPPFSFLPLGAAIRTAADLGDVIERVRAADPQSYLADFLETCLDDFSAAIAACKPEQAH